MAESRSHKRIKKQMAGPGGRTEVKLRSGKKLDAVSRRRVATEVERQGPRGIRKAVGRLAEAKRTKAALGAKLTVPSQDMGQAIGEMRRQGVAGRVQSLSNHKSYYVKSAGKSSAGSKNHPSKTSARRRASKSSSRRVR